MSTPLSISGGQKIAQYKSFVQKGIGVKYKDLHSGVPLQFQLFLIYSYF